MSTAHKQLMIHMSSDTLSTSNIYSPIKIAVTIVQKNICAHFMHNSRLMCYSAIPYSPKACIVVSTTSSKLQEKMLATLVPISWSSMGEPNFSVVV